MPKEDAYLATIDRFEPNIAMTDPGAYGTSIAISLKRIADALERLVPAIQPLLDQAAVDQRYRTRRRDEGS